MWAAAVPASAGVCHARAYPATQACMAIVPPRNRPTRAQLPASLRLEPLKLAGTGVLELGAGATLPESTAEVVSGAGQRLSRSFFGGHRQALRVVRAEGMGDTLRAVPLHTVGGWHVQQRSMQSSLECVPVQHGQQAHYQLRGATCAPPPAGANPVLPGTRVLGRAAGR